MLLWLTLRLSLALSQAFESAQAYAGVDSTLLKNLITWRRHIHANPELSYQEHEATDYIEKVLMELGLSVRRFSFGSGLICDIPAVDGSTASDVVALRADIDALPMEETTGCEFTSTRSGVCHACGHDGHTAMLLGAATLLVKNPPPRPVRLIFQPAEEQMPGGALDCVKDSAVESVDRRVDPRSGTVFTWGFISAGVGAPNVIPAKGTLVGTCRSASRDTWALLPDLVTPAIKSIAQPYGVECNVNYIRGVPPVVNDTVCADMAGRAAVDVLGKSGVCTAVQSSGGEDFGWYTEEIPGIYLRLGVWDGESPETDLHHPAFVMDERALIIGAAAFDSFARLDR